MKTNLTEPIAAYFHASNADDIAGLVACFLPAATVADENETHHGTDEIKNWAINVRKKYEFKAEVLSVAQSSDAHVVTAKVYGNFPGSPVNLDFRFTLDRDKIKALEIG